MNDAVRDFLRELYLMLKQGELDLEQASRDPKIMEQLFQHETARDLLSASGLLTNDALRHECIRVVRRMTSQIVFNILVMFDERRRLGKTGVVAELRLLIDDQPVEVPNYLHELFGDDMPELGMDIGQWSGLIP